MLIVSSPESFAFRLDEGKLGTIKNGHFKAANKLGIKGKIIVSYKKVSASINVSIGEKPIVINDFEEGIIKEKGKWWVSTSQPLINAKLSINDDERYVKFGEKSLRMDFDLRSSTGIGAISLYKVLDPENPNLSEPIIPKGNPTAIGMWVFGNFAQGAWIRCQYFVGSAIHYGEFGVVNWKGWKYVETKIYNPESLEIRIQFPIRIIALENYQRISGTLFFDRYRLIYGFIDDDTSLPTITNFTPSENSVINDFYPAISADLIDKDSGIDKNMTTLWFDKKKVEILTFQDIKNGVRLNYMPNFYQKITPGTHRAKIKAFDGFGNFTVKEWIFTVFSNTAKVYGVCTKKEKVYAGEFDQYQIFAESFENISGYNFKAQYNPHSIKIEKIIYGVESVHIAKEIINPFNGTIEIEIVEMNNIIKDDDKPFVEIIYSYLSDAIGEAYIKILESTITDNRNNNKINAVLPEFHMFVNNKYYLKFIGSTAQSLTEFYVATDGSVVEGAEIEVIYPIGITIEGITDAKGLLKTDVIGKLPVGILVRVRAVKDNLYSNIINIPILDSLGKEIPSRVVLSVGEDPSESVSFSWETNIFSNSSIVRIKSKETGLKEYNSDGRRRILVNTLFGRSETLMHALTVTDLIADTEYKYQIGNNDIWSEWKTFKTLKKEGKQAFLFYTDPQAFNEAGYKPLKNIYQEARNLNESISFAVASGDIVDNADNYDEWEYFDKVVGKDLGRMPHAMGIGNHEAVCNRNMFIGAFANPTNGIASLPKTNFFFKVGKALFLFIDTEAIDKFNEQKNWLKKTVRENNDSWKIVVMHRGPFPIYYESQAVRDFNSIFEELKIDLVLTGHDHIYNRTLHKGGIFKQKKGINYITGGSSGNKFYYKKPSSNVQQIIYAEKTPVFCIVEYDENELNYKAYTLAEKTKEIDAFTLRKNK